MSNFKRKAELFCAWMAGRNLPSPPCHSCGKTNVIIKASISLSAKNQCELACQDCGLIGKYDAQILLGYTPVRIKKLK